MKRFQMTIKWVETHYRDITIDAPSEREAIGAVLTSDYADMLREIDGVLHVKGWDPDVSRPSLVDIEEVERDDDTIYQLALLAQTLGI